MTGRQTLNLTF